MAAKMRELTEQNMQEFVKEVENRKIPLHSVLIAQHGNLLFEKYYAPYCRNKLQRMFSVTKSFAFGPSSTNVSRLVESTPLIWVVSSVKTEFSPT